MMTRESLSVNLIAGPGGVLMRKFGSARYGCFSILMVVNLSLAILNSIILSSSNQLYRTWRQASLLLERLERILCALYNFDLSALLLLGFP